MVLITRKLKKISKKRKLVFFNIFIILFLVISFLSLVPPDLDIFRFIPYWHAIECSTIFSDDVKVTDRMIKYCNQKKDYQLNQEVDDIYLTTATNENLLANVKTYMRDDDFKTLNERINLHGYLWYSLFDSYAISRDEGEYHRYKYKLLYRSSFLHQKSLGGLTDKEKLLATLHKSLYSWAYGEHYHSLADMIQSSEGRGIVLLSRPKEFGATQKILDNLRHVLRTNLPVHVFYFGKNGLSEKNIEILRQYNLVTFSDLSYYFDWSLNINGFGMKPFSLLASPFEETILLDQGVVFLQDPEELFGHEGYRRTGSLFLRATTVKVTREEGGEKSGIQWLKSWLTDPLPETKGLRYYQGRTSQEMDSSTIVLHKTKTIQGLLATCTLNGFRIRRKILENSMEGIHESFWIGFDMARQPYSFDPSRPTIIGEMRMKMDSEGGILCGYQGHVINNKLFYYWDNPSPKVEIQENKEDINNYYFNHNDNIIDQKIHKDSNGSDSGEDPIIPTSYVVEGDGLWDPWTKCYSLGSHEKPYSFTEEEKKILHKIIEND